MRSNGMGDKVSIQDSMGYFNSVGAPINSHHTELAAILSWLHLGHKFFSPDFGAMDFKIFNRKFIPTPIHVYPNTRFVLGEEKNWNNSNYRKCECFSSSLLLQSFFTCHHLQFPPFIKYVHILSFANWMAFCRCELLHVTDILCQAIAFPASLSHQQQ